MSMVCKWLSKYISNMVVNFEGFLCEGVGIDGSNNVCIFISYDVLRCYLFKCNKDIMEVEVKCVRLDLDFIWSERGVCFFIFYKV